MRRPAAICLVEVIVGLLCTAPMLAQPGPFNGLPIAPVDSTGVFRILIGGHFHGESTNRSGYPAATLLANLDTINALGADLFLSTGDLFMDPVGDAERYRTSLFEKLHVPLFNAPGNHDVSRRAETTSAEFPFTLDAAGMRIVLLNTEEGNGSLSSKDLEVLGSIVSEGAAGSVKAVMIISHRPVWAQEDPEYGPLFADNTRSLFATNFRGEVYPVVERIAAHIPVYWISGSMGGRAPSSIFFQQHAPNITFMQCAIRDEPRDALLIADVHDGAITWTALSLTGQKLLPPATYNAEWWRDHGPKEKPFNWRLLPYLTRSTVTHPAFWWGMAAMLLLSIGIRRLIRR
jgi:hypothetical protein